MIDDVIAYKDEICLYPSEEYKEKVTSLAKYVNRNKPKEDLLKYVKRIHMAKPRVAMTNHAKERLKERSIEPEMAEMARKYGSEIRAGLFKLELGDIPFEELKALSPSFRKRLEKTLPICAGWEHSKTSNDIICTTAYRLFENDTKHKHRTNWKRGKPGARKHRW
jgi:hypothetical protein